MPSSAPPVAAAATDENASIENRWGQLWGTVQSTALAVLSRSRRQHQDLFDDNGDAISNLLVEKSRLHKACVYCPTGDNRATFNRSRRLVKQRLREMQDTWTARKAERAQGYADRKEWKNSAIKAIYGPPTKGTALLLSVDGRALPTEKTNSTAMGWPLPSVLEWNEDEWKNTFSATKTVYGKTQILKRWAEHSSGVLTRPFTISDAALACLPQMETNVDLDFPSSLHETLRAVQHHSSGKATGSDAIPA
nr:unnamed protein product [Spirometra erinaceieuropaei]